MVRVNKILRGSRGRTKVKSGWREINGHRIYFRSGWEYNYALYLEFLRAQGEISKWEFEPDTFWFENIKRGVRSYLPDFKVTDKSGVVYHEVKGYMDPKSKTKIKRMAKYHPHIKLIVIGKKEYTEIKKKLGAILGFE